MTLRFPYAPDATGALPASVVPPGVSPFRYRPILALRVFGPDPPGKHVQMSALVDSGSDWTVMGKHFATMLGVSSYIAARSVTWRGISVPIDLAHVELEISSRGASWRWPAVVGFIQARLSFPCLLGHTGFLEFMHSRFMGDHRVLELETNPLFQVIGGHTAP